MRLIFLGPPGCGKGTQAKLLSNAVGLEHISTGDILRDAMRRKTPAGDRARPFIEAGHLVPDDLVNALVAERFDADDRPDRFIMDGYPRTLGQGEAFDRVLRRHELGLNCVVLFRVDEEELVRRVSGRLSCPKTACRATYHVVSRPPRVPGVCDLCGTPLVQRADDKEETVRERLSVYHQQTEGLIAFYRSRGLLRELDGDGEIKEVYCRLLGVLQPQAGSSCSGHSSTAPPS
jgi:adenylate kinase